MSRLYNADRPFQTIAEAAQTTGLSQFFIRKACHEGTCPHIKAGKTFMVNVPMLVQQLNEQSIVTAKIAH